MTRSPSGPSGLSPRAIQALRSLQARRDERLSLGIEDLLREK
jgi:hypothetical protein